MSRTGLYGLLAAFGLSFACSGPNTSPGTECGSNASCKAPNAAPTIELAEPRPGDVLNQDTIDLSGSVSDDSGIPSAEYSLDGSTWQALTLDDHGAFSVKVPAPEGVGVSVALSVRAVDDHGEQTATQVEIVVNNARPTLVIASPNDGAIVGPAAVTTLTFKGTALDPVTMSPAKVTLDFQDGQGARDVTNGTGGFELAVPLGDEDYVGHDVVLTATDARGVSTTRTVHVIVDRVAPQLSITSPAQNQPFNLAALAASTDVAGAFTKTDGDPQAHVELQTDVDWTPLTGDAFTLPTKPTDDGVTYTFRLRALDTAGNVTVQTRSFGVDRVAPTAVFDRADGARLTAPAITATFSEPVTAAAAPFTLSPAAGVAQAPVPFSGTAFTVAQLPGDSVFTASLAAGAVVDGFGNPNAQPLQLKFHTRPAQPASGSVQVLRTDVTAFDLASDGEGVVSIVAATNSSAAPMVAFTFDGKTGAVANQLSSSLPSGTLQHLASASFTSPNLDLTSHRASGFQIASSTQTSAPGVNDGKAAFGSAGDAFYVPVAPGCADPAGAAETGVVTQGKQFVRGLATETTALTPQRLLVESPDYWELVGLDGGVLKAQARACTCSSAQNACSWKSARTLVVPGTLFLPNEPRLSVTGTASGDRRLYVVDDGNGQRFELCEASCASAGCPANANQSAPASEGLFVASAHSGNSVIAARRTAAGVQLLQRDLQTSCTGTWTPLGTAPASSGAFVTAWRPAMFGTKPGLVWLDGPNLKLYIP